MNLLTIKPINPIAATIICTGIAIPISFFTPDKEVNVEEPVKFIAINDDIQGIMKNHDMISKILLPRKFAKNKIIAVKSPIIKPLSEKLLKGIYGSSIGVKIIPAV